MIENVLNYPILSTLIFLPALGVIVLAFIPGKSKEVLRTTALGFTLVLLTTFLSIIAVLCSWTAVTERVKEYMMHLLILETGMLGVFVSLDLILFFIFWEIGLIPMYFLIGVWGGPRRLYA